MFQKIRDLLARLLWRLFPPESRGWPLHQWAGDSAPAPDQGGGGPGDGEHPQRGARRPGALITHNLRLVVYIAKKFEVPAPAWRT